MRTRDISLCAMLVVGGCAHHQRAPETRAEAEQRAIASDVHREQPMPSERPELTRAEDPGAPVPGVPADNTEINERDRSSAALTPMDQSESEPDRDLLQRIRKAVIADDSLSFDAKNVKIITRNGQVTLRGAVANAREKASIEKAARDAAGIDRVTNQLEVAN
ncbi:MAG TPA: BON domain-containing protein [Polyangiales bacterium]|nr:BON domain-containing protein [Polyangiales bacterium]